MARAFTDVGIEWKSGSVPEGGERRRLGNEAGEGHGVAGSLDVADCKYVYYAMLFRKLRRIYYVNPLRSYNYFL